MDTALIMLIIFNVVLVRVGAGRRPVGSFFFTALLRARLTKVVTLRLGLGVEHDKAVVFYTPCARSDVNCHHTSRGGPLPTPRTYHKAVGHDATKSNRSSEKSARYPKTKVLPLETVVLAMRTRWLLAFVVHALTPPAHRHPHRTPLTPAHRPLGRRQCPSRPPESLPESLPVPRPLSPATDPTRCTPMQKLWCLAHPHTESAFDIQNLAHGRPTPEWRGVGG